MSPTQTPPVVPGADQLKDLPESVAILLLVAIMLLALLVYFGAPIRDRLTKKPPSSSPGDARPQDVAAAVAAGAPPVAAPALDRAAAVEDQYRANLLAQIEKLEARVAAVERKNEELDRKNDELHRENLTLRADLERARLYQPPPGWPR